MWPIRHITETEAAFPSDGIAVEETIAEYWMEFDRLSSALRHWPHAESRVRPNG